GRLGEPERALRQYRDVIAHWRRLGSHTHQLTTLRNLVVLLAQLGADEPAAVLHGAVTVDVTPSFGLEARRLEAAWGSIEERLGPEQAAAAARRGRRLTASQMGEVALRHVDALLAAG
nr:transcriptional regulator [Gemmatimonadota bacterium]NIR40594.1 transcriptional regulator [Actinomycetota bacterium]NIS35520.1 transcriptional regulator [Actinomycetota bacterium]NIU70182.1 transcriptional regulator [Actinomycetota bacterium]NIW32068.1 transcriptional regulator [Actinomycetota bacterium]